MNTISDLLFFFYSLHGDVFSSAISSNVSPVAFAMIFGTVPRDFIVQAIQEADEQLLVQFLPKSNLNAKSVYGFT